MQHLSNEETQSRVENSVLDLQLLAGTSDCSKQIEQAFSIDGCGATLIKLDEPQARIYERFYKMMWAIETGYVNLKDVIIEFYELEGLVRGLMLSCGVSLVRARAKTSNRPFHTDLAAYLLDEQLPSARGRPLASDRREFHPSVAALLAGERVGKLSPEDRRLLAIYREWEASSPADRLGCGNKTNGNIYYGAFRGRLHVDSGRTVTVLLGPGDLRDRIGRPPHKSAQAHKLGGALSVVPPGSANILSLPYRLSESTPYVIVFFEKPVTPPTEPGNLPVGTTTLNDRRYLTMQLRIQNALDVAKRGWAPTVHGVSRIEDRQFSRAQVAIHLLLTEEDVCA